LASKHMRYLDVCAGISAPTVAWRALQWECAAYSEIEAFPRAVLAYHYPDTPLHGDFTTIGADDYGSIDLLVGGTPCQSFSIAGLRGGLGDDRGNLALEYLRLADRKSPRWLVWENVPGVLSVDGGRAFSAILGGMAELGYGFAYRVLDAQHFGVPQRRRRVFVIGYLGDWRRAAAVLFEREGLSRNLAPRREKGASVAALTANGVGTCGAYDNQGQARHILPVNTKTASTMLVATKGAPVAKTILASGGQRFDPETENFVTHFPIAIQAGATRVNPESGPGGIGVCTDGVAYTLEAKAEAQIVCFTAKDYGADAGEIAPTLRAGGFTGSHATGGVMPAVAFQSSQSGVRVVNAHATLDANNGSRRHNGVIQGSSVRRLTPRECERLQGFPDNFTLVPHRNKPASDGPRYKALGNSMAVPVVKWIGERIAMVDAL
jgi:DNA (cytosine-5)-methyltransferase 1